MRWASIDTDSKAVSILVDGLGVSTRMAQLLVQRGITSPETAEAFLKPKLAQLDDPFAIANLKAAVKRVEEAIERKDSVIIFGDYDVDGVTSTVQLVTMLRQFDLEPRFSVPRRMEEGYGLSKRAIDRVFDGTVPRLFIAVDCGTNAHEPIAYLRGHGVDVIILDHHQTKTEPPEDCIFVNPHVNDPPGSPWTDLCTAGLVFKLFHGLLKRRREASDPRVEEVRLRDYLDLIALGTIADLVPLHHENRVLAWFGLRHLTARRRPGIRALAQVSGIESGQEIVSSNVSFKMAPRINASGRLADACLSINLLLEEDPGKCRRMAEKIDAINKERQAIESAIATDGEKRAEAEFTDAPGIVLLGEDWHPGVVGIIASRVSRRFNKPCVILGADGDTAKGSGRSVASVNLIEVFDRCAHLLDRWGGHPMAAGIELQTKDVRAFTDRFIQALQELYPDGLPEPTLEIAFWLRSGDLGTPFLEELDSLHPFGLKNPKPVFGMKAVVLNEAPVAFGKGHFRFRMPSEAGTRGIAGVAWGVGLPPKVGEPIDLAFQFSWNYWRNSRYPQVTLINWKPGERI